MGWEKARVAVMMVGYTCVVWDLFLAFGIFGTSIFHRRIGTKGYEQRSTEQLIAIKEDFQ